MRGRKTLQKKTLQESQEREQTLCAAARKQIENERERKENERKERERERENDILSLHSPLFRLFHFRETIEQSGLSASRRNILFSFVFHIQRGKA